MPRHLSSAVCTAALLLAGASTVALAPPAFAAINARIGFDFFRDRLAPYGHWMHHPLWGDVWRPRSRLVGVDFQPYTNGYWEYTDEYGWYWVSDDAFDDVVYHYGRWVYDPQWGWLWLPGYTWAPAWVVWRQGDDYTGWMPLPPDEGFISGRGFAFGLNLGPIGINFYDRWYRGRVDPSRFFVFVDNRHLVQRDYRRYVVPREKVKIVLGRTRDVTKFEVSNGRVVNRGVDLKVVERAAGRPIARVSAKTVIKPNAVITTVDEAKQIRERERAAHPVNAEAGKRGGAEGGAGETGGRNSEEPNASPAGGAGEKGNPMSPPAREPSDQSSAETPKKKRPAESDNRMSNPSGETMPEAGGGASETPKKKRPANPSGGMMGPDTGGSMTGPGDGAGSSGGSDIGNAAPPRHRTRPEGSMSGPQTAPAGSMNGPRPAPAGGSMSGPQPGGATSPEGSTPQAPTEPKKKRKTTGSDQPQTEPH